MGCSSSRNFIVPIIESAVHHESVHCVTSLQLEETNSKPEQHLATEKEPIAAIPEPSAAMLFYVKTGALPLEELHRPPSANGMGELPSSEISTSHISTANQLICQDGSNRSSAPPSLKTEISVYPKPPLDHQIGSRSIAKVGDVRGGRALSKASEYGDEPVVLELLSAGYENIDERDLYGQTSLMLAAEGRHEGIVKALVAAGADVNAVDRVSLLLLLFIHLSLIPRIFHRTEGHL